MVRERATQHAITITVEGSADGVDTVVADEPAIQAGGPQPAVQRRQVHPRTAAAFSSAPTPRGPTSWSRSPTPGSGFLPRTRSGSSKSFQQGRRGAPKEEGHGSRLTLSRRIVGLFRRKDVAQEHSRGRKARSASRSPTLLERHGRGRLVRARRSCPSSSSVDDDRASLISCPPNLDVHRLG